MVQEQTSQEKFERPSLSKQQIAKARAAFAERLEDIVTRPDMDGAGFPLDLPEKVRLCEKIERNRTIRDSLVATGQDFRFTPDQIRFLEEMFLK